MKGRGGGAEVDSRAWFPLDWWAAAAGIPPVTACHPAPLEKLVMASATPGLSAGKDSLCTRTHPMDHF